MVITNRLLTTKLYAPPPRRNFVQHPHLIARLEQGMRDGHRRLLLSAPAGYGKTTLLAAWLCETKHLCTLLALGLAKRLLGGMVAASQSYTEAIQVDRTQLLTPFTVYAEYARALALIERDQLQVADARSPLARDRSALGTVSCLCIRSK